MELNKIAAAILLAGLIGMITGKVAGFLYGGGEDAAHHGEGHTEVARGYSIEVPEDMSKVGAVEAKEEALPSILPLLADANASKGEAYFAKKCSLCHTHEQGGANKTGPNLWNVVGRDKGGHAGFGYSNALAEAEGDWTYEDLNGFLHKPKRWLPGTIMAYAGIRKPEDRANVIAYLRSLSNNPEPIPDITAPQVESGSPEAEAADAQADTEMPSADPENE